MMNICTLISPHFFPCDYTHAPHHPPNFSLCAKSPGIDHGFHDDDDDDDDEVVALAFGFWSAAATAATFNAPRCYQSGNDSCGHSPPKKPNIRPCVSASGTHMQHTKCVSRAQKTEMTRPSIPSHPIGGVTKLSQAR